MTVTQKVLCMSWWFLPRPELKIGNAYIRRNGEKIEHFPADMGELEDITVHRNAAAFMILLSLSVL